MRYIRIQRSNYEGIITIGEYVEIMQPWAYRELKILRNMLLLAEKARDITEQILQAADISGKDKFYERILKERPFPGRGGLLPGEREDVL